MRSLSFTLDTQTGGTADPIAPATITITEQLDGTLLFTVDNINDSDNQIGDIRSLFFDVANDDLLGTLSVSGSDVTEFVQDGDVSNMGNGANSNGVPDSPYEVGVEIGTQGAAANDIQTTSFVLSTSIEGGLTLDDIALESFFVRQTSVGDADGSRDGSDKLYGDAPYPVNAIDDVVDVTEDTTVSGNVFANDIDEDAGDENNDGIPDGLTVAALDGDSANVGQPIAVGDENSGVTIAIDADGTYSVNAENADYLAEGETFSDTVTYTVEDGNGGSDTATVTVNVTGVNDQEVITGGDNEGSVTEISDGSSGENATTLTDSGVLSFADVDLSDDHTLQVTTLGTEYLGNFNASITDASTGDGTGEISWNFEVDDILLDSLAEGEQITQNYDIEVSDGIGEPATTTVSVVITGSNDGPIITGGDNEGSIAELPDGSPGENATILSDSGFFDFADVDLIDAHTLSTAPQSGDYIGTFEAFINEDSTGTGDGEISWNFSVSDAFLDGLAEGEQLVQSYDITIDDGHGGTATETVAITLTGAADETEEPKDNFGVEVNKKGVEMAISNVVLYLQDGDDIIKAKIDNWDSSFSDLDDVNLTAFLDREFSDAELLAVSIKSGNNHNRDLGPGEGQLYLIDGDPDVDYQEGGAVPDALSLDILGAKADVTYDYDMSLFV